MTLWSLVQHPLVEKYNHTLLSGGLLTLLFLILFRAKLTNFRLCNCDMIGRISSHDSKRLPERSRSTTLGQRSVSPELSTPASEILLLVKHCIKDISIIIIQNIPRFYSSPNFILLSCNILVVSTYFQSEWKTVSGLTLAQNLL